MSEEDVYSWCAWFDEKARERCVRMRKRTSAASWIEVVQAIKRVFTVSVFAHA